MRQFFIIIFFILSALPMQAQNNDNLNKQKYLQLQKQKATHKRTPKYHFGYFDRDHTFTESAKLVGYVYAASWVGYPLSQPKVFRDQGSFTNYRKNFGHLVFDRDEPFWNWLVHPLSGSQLFLFYRANGYGRINSLAMSFISSTLFEFTVEIYTEPASIQDLYQTPILGSILGVGLETLSLYLINTGNALGKIIGHTINPWTLFKFFEGKVRVYPHYRETENNHKKGGLVFYAEF